MMMLMQSHQPTGVVESCIHSRHATTRIEIVPADRPGGWRTSSKPTIWNSFNSNKYFKHLK